MAVGIPLPTNYTDGDVWSASDVNDITGTINQLGGGNYAAGKNKIINGDLGVWQRGTSFAMTGSGIYTADRWGVAYSGATGPTVSQYVMTPQELNDFKFGLSLPGTLTDAVNGYILIRQPIEDVRTLSNQTVTVSFYAKGSASGTIGLRLVQDFGTGGSPSSSVTITPQTQAITTTWTRYTFNFTIPSISGKTIGTNSDSKLFVNIDKNIGTGNSIGYGTNPNYTGTLSFTGVQIEAGSAATAFQTATGTIQGELAACQRYYYRAQATAAYSRWAVGQCTSSTAAAGFVKFPITMRTAPSSLEQTGTASNYGLTNSGTSVIALSSVPSFDSASPDGSTVVFNVSSGLSAGNATQFLPNGNTTAYLGWSAEL